MTTIEQLRNEVNALEQNCKALSQILRAVLNGKAAVIKSDEWDAIMWDEFAPYQKRSVHGGVAIECANIPEAIQPPKLPPDPTPQPTRDYRSEAAYHADRSNFGWNLRQCLADPPNPPQEPTIEERLSKVEAWINHEDTRALEASEY